MKKLLVFHFFLSLIFIVPSKAQVVVTKQNIFDLSTLAISGSSDCIDSELVVTQTRECLRGASAIPSRCDFLFWNDFPGGPIPRAIRTSDELNRSWNCDPRDPATEEPVIENITAWFASFPVDGEPLPRPGEGEILAFNPQTNSRINVPMVIRKIIVETDEDAPPGESICMTDPICNINVSDGTTTRVTVNAPHRAGTLIFKGWYGIRYDYTSGSPMTIVRISGGNPISFSPEDHITAVAIYSQGPTVRTCPLGTETVGSITAGGIEFPITRCRTSPPDLLGELELRYPLPFIFDLCSIRPCCAPNALSCPTYQLRLEGFKGLMAHFVNPQGVKIGQSIKKGNQFDLSITPDPGEPVYLYMMSTEENVDGKVRLYKPLETIEPDPTPWRLLFFGALAFAALLLILIFRRRG